MSLPKWHLLPPTPLWKGELRGTFSPQSNAQIQKALSKRVVPNTPWKVYMKLIKVGPYKSSILSKGLPIDHVLWGCRCNQPT